MIGKSNYKEVINSMSKMDKSLIMSDIDHEYTELELCVFNAGSAVYATLTNSLENLDKLVSEGNIIFRTETVQRILREGKNE